MNNRLFLYSGLFLVIILLYDAWHNKEINSKVSQDTIPETVTEPRAPNNNKTTKPQTRNQSKDPIALSSDFSDSVVVTTDTLEVEISLSDGSLISSRLLKFAEEFGVDEKKVQLLDKSIEKYIARVGVQSSDMLQPRKYESKQKNYRLDDNDHISVELIGTSKDNVRLVKKYTFRKGSHLIDINQTIKNISPRVSSWRQYYTLERGDELNSNAMLYTYTGAAYYDDDEKFSKIDFSDIEANNFLKNTNNSWISMIEHYFFTAWLPTLNSAEPQTIYTRFSIENANKQYLIGSVGNYKNIEPDMEVTFNSRLYVGPKTQAEIKELAPGLDLTVDYGVLTFLAAPLFWILDKIFFVLGNWGWSIVALTFLIKLLFFRLSETSYKSMAKMKKLTPRMTALKERYGEDRKKFSEALMKIYKEEKVNPLGGCLPILIQIPVFIALYWVIIESVEMRHAPFAGWILDLSSADPFFILPILMGISMYIQQKLNPPPTDPMQQKIFLALPFIFTFLFATFPSGLVLYWLTNNVLSIAQQYVINKRTLA